jgi:hypothetical protein
MQRHIATGMIWLGWTITLCALGWGVSNAAALLTQPIRSANSLALNVTPIVIVSGVPALIGWWIARAGARRRAPPANPQASIFD